MDDKGSPPPSTLKRFMWYVLSFGVSAGLGLAPFLGNKKVPGFRALLDLFPTQIQDELIPISAFLMGLVALAIHFYSGERVRTASLKRWFKLGFAGMLGLLLALFVIYKIFVVRLEMPAIKRSVAVLVGWSPLDSCDCRKLRLGKKLCVKRVSVRPEAIEACWGERPDHAGRASIVASLSDPYGGLWRSRWARGRKGTAAAKQAEKSCKYFQKRARKAPPTVAISEASGERYARSTRSSLYGSARPGTPRFSRAFERGFEDARRGLLSLFLGGLAQTCRRRGRGNSRISSSGTRPRRKLGSAGSCGSSRRG